MTLANRRQFERFPFSSRLEVRRSDGSQPSGPMHGTALDVSVGGFGFRSTGPLRVGDRIAVNLLAMERLQEDDLRREAGSDDSGTEIPLEIHAIVRHVYEEAGDYFIGAER